MKIQKSLVVFGVLSACATSAHAQQLLNSDFSTYASGNLVGQNGWAQFGTSATSPLQVTSGQVVIPGISIATGGASVDNQDASHTFTVVPAPTSGTTSLYVGLNLTVLSATSAASPSYFFGLVDNSTTNNFVNGRLTAKDNGNGTFDFGARVTG